MCHCAYKTVETPRLQRQDAESEGKWDTFCHEVKNSKTQGFPFPGLVDRRFNS